MSNIALVFSLLIVRGLSAHASPRHSSAENDADTVAKLEISLDPPAIPFPVAQHAIDRMEANRERLEATGMHRLLGAFATAKETARTRLGGIVQHAMYTVAAAAPRGATFLEARESFVPHTVPAPRTTARVQVYAPDMGGGAEIGVKALEQHRSDAEGSMIEEAIASMAGITDLVCDALEVELRGWIEDVSVRWTPIQRQEATSFWHVRTMSLVGKIGEARAVPVHNNIKIIRPAARPPCHVGRPVFHVASFILCEVFPTIASLVRHAGLIAGLSCTANPTTGRLVVQKQGGACPRACWHGRRSISSFGC